MYERRATRAAFNPNHNATQIDTLIVMVLLPSKNEVTICIETVLAKRPD